ncbi:Xaa-Pro aminopeptidase [Rossellomorea oryzaecorticis]|jgi:hypothetical protein|uniref:Xaa-Pro aminopeptidase n=1 Tax=Rossellomorea oryzaecorticis TaxID=1396505 RepID=A0ABW8VM89_9BACI|nr:MULTISPECIES: hypothetical protein [Bacillaceae]MBH9965874.1 Xaa-Pro aminopeptidase [[Bacillus] enclensis]QWC22282.1 Xaa-Pro aminopeptidase [Bacillus haikouensis]
MLKKIPLLFVLLLGLISSLSFGTPASADIGVELRNADAFSGKNYYYSSTGYYNNASYSSHRSAFSNAASKMNAVANTSISLHTTSGSKSDPIEINMYSVNSSSYDWYGYANYDTGYATLRINEYVCKNDGFSQSNYNKVALHELGHAYYAVHQHSSVSSVMKQGKYSYTDYTTLDKSNFAYKY